MDNSPDGLFNATQSEVSAMIISVSFISGLFSLSKEFQVPYFFLAEKTPFASFHILFGKTGKSYPVKVLHIITQVFKDAADDTVTAAVYLNTDLGLVFAICIS